MNRFRGVTFARFFFISVTLLCVAVPVCPISASTSATHFIADDPKAEKPPELKFESTDPEKNKEPPAGNGKANGKKDGTKKKDADAKKDEQKSDKKDSKKDSKKDNKKDNKKDEGRYPKVEPFYYEYTIEEGDSPELISIMYGVSVERLKRWNKGAIPRRGALKVGTVLKIYADSPIRVKRKANYETQKGDTLKKLVRKLKTSEKDLRIINRLKSSKLQPGTSLIYLTASSWPASQSVGKCSGGRLENGEKLPAGPGYSYGSRPNVYGTNETVTLLLDIFAKFKKKYPKGPKLVVGNLSRNTGGALSPHKSHQSGRDVDLGFVIKKEYQPVTHMVNANDKNLDCEKTWFLMEAIIKTGKVKYMFVDFEVQRILYEYLMEKKYPKAKLKKYFQYPNKGTEALIKHVQGHVHHIHLRFVCPRSDKECTD